MVIEISDDVLLINNSILSSEVIYILYTVCPRIGMIYFSRKIITLVTNFAVIYYNTFV